ncbi:ATP-binding protein [Tumidithrix helvetica PCC 7403]|uniref:ATP-binding protein n=1 Tax=Tumidithrix helvetica TaxID=3457545 RepID=UPI003C8C7FCD
MFKKISIRTVLVFLFTLQTVGVVGLVSYLSLKNGEQAVNDVANQLREELSIRIDDKLKTYVTIPHRINDLNANALAKGEIDLLKAKGVNFFWQQMQLFPAISYVYCGSEQGDFLGVGKLADDRSLRLVTGSPSTKFLRSYYSLDVTGNRAQLTKVSDKPYDPRVRPWYKAVKAEGKTTWSEIYLDTNTQLPTITGATPAFHPQNAALVGVCAVDFFLPKEVSQFLTTLKLGKTGHAFIMERSGLLVATSTGESPTIGSEPNFKRLSATESQNLPIRSTATYLRDRFGNDLQRINENQQLDFVWNNQRQFVQVLPFKDGRNLDWLIVLVIPESDFLERIHANTQTTILLSSLAIAVAVLIGIVAAGWIVKPIADLNTAAKSLAENDENTRVDIHRRDEVGELAQSFNRMAECIHQSFVSLRDRETQLKQFLDAMPVGILIVNPQGEPDYINQAGQLLFGQDLDRHNPAPASYQFYVAGTTELYPEEIAPLSQALQGKSIATDNIELRYQNQVIPLEVRGTPIYDEAGNITHAIVVFQNITERKQAEKLREDYNRTLEQQVAERTVELEKEITERKAVEISLTKSEARSHAILSAIPDLMFNVTGDGIYLGYIYSDNTIDLLPSDFDPVGKHISQFLPEEICDRHLFHMHQALITGKIQIYEQQVLVNGKLQDEEVRIVVSGQNEVLFMVRDISDRKQAEAALYKKNAELASALEELKNTQKQLVESEKNAALGGMVAGIAHEVNTPVGSSLMAASILDNATRKFKESFDRGELKKSSLQAYLEKAKSSCEILLANLQRAAELIQNFKQVAVDQASLEQRTFAVKQYIEGVLISLEPQLKHTPHKVSVHGDAEIVMRSYPGAFSQIVTNLVMNSLTHAYHGIDKVGQLRFDLTLQEDNVLITYSDDGKGIPADSLAKIFEPFFTTARDRGGSGLGLHIIYNLVTQNLKGTIVCESAMGVGTKFILTLPLVLS